MVGRDDDEVLLCCLLWAHDGEVAGLSAYEDTVLALIEEHGGQVVQRAQHDGDDGNPHEVQLYRFESPTALTSYLNDSRRTRLGPERDRVIKRTELFPVRFR
ncbi:MAG: hypothetical protein QM662_12235 [Gordonia sp. (in: high G+C Gram-positive bacteria)]